MKSFTFKLLLCFLVLTVTACSTENTPINPIMQAGDKAASQQTKIVGERANEAAKDVAATQNSKAERGYAFPEPIGYVNDFDNL